MLRTQTWRHRQAWPRARERVLDAPRDSPLLRELPQVDTVEAVLLDPLPTENPRDELPASACSVIPVIPPEFQDR